MVLGTGKNNFSSLNKALRALSHGAAAQTQRLRVVAENMANAGNRSVDPSVDPYRRKLINFKTEYERTMGIDLVKVDKITRDERPFKMVYDPGHPGANADGFVKTSNVDFFTEAADLQEASRSHEASIKAMERIYGMIASYVEFLRN